MFTICLCCSLDEPFELSIGDLGEPINMSFMVYDYFESCSLNATSCSFTNELMHLSFSKKLTINVPKDTVSEPVILRSIYGTLQVLSFGDKVTTSASFRLSSRKMSMWIMCD